MHSRPQKTEASSLERWIKLGRTIEKVRQVPLAKGQSQQQRVNRENELGQSRAGLGNEGNWATGQGGASRASLRSRAKQRDGDADREKEKVVGGGTGRSAWDRMRMEF